MRRPNVLALMAALVLGVAALSRAGADPAMQRFIIERDIPGASRMTPAEMSAAASKSNAVLHDLGSDIQWVQSYVAGDRLYCVYNARSAELIKRHAELSGFPANRITPVTAVIDPTTADSSAVAVADAVKAAGVKP